MKWLKRILLSLAVLLVIAQVIRPARTNPPLDPAKELRAPEPVMAIVQRSCQDCHSHRTVWPWYSQVAPASWLLVKDVNEARRHLNFSEWSTQTPRRVAHKFEEISEMVESGEMPLWFYVPLHATAKLTDADRRTLVDWARAERARIIKEHPEAERPSG